MDVKEIMDAFNQAPLQSKYDAIIAEANEYDKLAEQMKHKSKLLYKKAYEIVPSLNNEGDKVANELDVKFPNWRMALVNHLKGVK